MNKKGFTLVELLATIIIIGLVMTLIMPSASKVSKNNKKRIYKEYEKAMIEYAEVSSLKDGNVIKLSQMNEFGEEELGKVKKECDGYVLIDHSSTIPVYSAYITCGDQYTTTDFNSSYLN